MVIPNPQEGFAVHSSRVFKPRFCFAKFHVGSFRVTNIYKRHNGNTKYEQFHRHARPSQSRTRVSDPKFRRGSSYPKRSMSALGRLQTFCSAIVMSTLPPKADIRRMDYDVR